MITRSQKAETVKKLVEKLKGSNSVYLMDYMGMTVDEIMDFRSQLREKNVHFQVAKNTLVYRALEEIDNTFNIQRDALKGPTAVAITVDDPTVPAKILKEYLKKHDLPKLKLVSIEGQIFGEKDLEAITKLPTREDMIAGIIGSLGSPASGIVRALDQATPLVNVLGAVTRDLISVIDQVAQKQNNAA